MADPGEVAAACEDKRRRKVRGERLRLAVNYVHAVAPAVLGFGAPRFALDQPPPRSRRDAFCVAPASPTLEGWVVDLLRHRVPDD